MTGPEATNLVTAIASVFAAITGMIAAIGVVLSKLGRDSQKADNNEIKSIATTAVKQNATLDSKADMQIAQNEAIAKTVNGPLTHALKSNAVLAEQVADLTKTSKDDVNARVARQIADTREVDIRVARALSDIPAVLPMAKKEGV